MPPKIRSDLHINDINFSHVTNPRVFSRISYIYFQYIIPTESTSVLWNFFPVWYGFYKKMEPAQQYMGEFL